MSSTIKAAIQALKSRIADAYTAIVAKGGALPATQDSANLPSAIASIPSGSTLDTSGFTLNNQNPTSLFDIMCGTDVKSYDDTDYQRFVLSGSQVLNLQFPDLEEITLPYISTNANCIGAGNIWSGRKRLRYLSLANWQDSADAVAICSNCPNLEEVNFPTLYRLRAYPSFGYCPKLKELNLPGWQGTGTSIQLARLDTALERFSCGKLTTAISTNNAFQGCTSLIDFEVGTDTDINLDIRMWNPTNVLSDSTKVAQLITNIRNHILAKVKTMTSSTQRTFTVSQNMYNVITAADTQLASDFLAKYWLLAAI